MKYLIVANGHFLPKSIILEAAQNAKIIALDGALSPLMHLGIYPDIVLGDFDSLFSAEHSNVNNGVKHPITFIHKPDPNFTDLQKALQFSLQEEATSIHIVCALGGRLDHEQAVIHALEQAYTPHCPIYLHSTDQSAYIANNETITIRGNLKDYCGLFGAPLATMSVKNKGLAYGGEDPYELSFNQYSTSNHLIDKEAIVEIRGKALIIHPPMLESQRIFSKKSRQEQLRIMLNELLATRK